MGVGGSGAVVNKGNSGNFVHVGRENADRGREARSSRSQKIRLRNLRTAPNFILN